MKELKSFRKFLKEGYTLSDFEKLEDVLYQEDIPGQLLLQKDGSMDMLLGRDYPDSLADKASHLAKNLGISLGVMADGSFRDDPIKSAMVNGGPQEWDGDWYDEDDDEGEYGEDDDY
jgi:hypothetical protein